MNKTRTFLLIPAVALVVSFFLPYVAVGRAGASGLDLILDGGNALLLLAGAIAMVVAALLPKPKAKFAAPYQWVYLAGASAATLFFVLLVAGRGDFVRTFSNTLFNLVGIGGWIGLIAGIAGIVLSFTYKKLK